jgi:hypothetical protein
METDFKRLFRNINSEAFSYWRRTLPLNKRILYTVNLDNNKFVNVYTEVNKITKFQAIYLTLKFICFSVKNITLYKR